VKFQRAVKLVGLLMKRTCVAGLSTLAQETGRWPRSAKRQEIDQQSTARLQKPESQTSYTGYMVKYACYVLRIVADKEARMAQGGCSEDSDAGSEQTNEEKDLSDSRSSGSGSIEVIAIVARVVKAAAGERRI
jgi:hypothetical protein